VEVELKNEPVRLVFSEQGCPAGKNQKKSSFIDLVLLFNYVVRDTRYDFFQTGFIRRLRIACHSLFRFRIVLPFMFTNAQFCRTPDETIEAWSSRKR
jgi:hypothetical protein